MIRFLRENIVCDIFLILGILSWIITVGAYISGKKSGRYVSGLPAVGGIMVAIGFLTSSAKYLAFLGLLDPALFYLIFKVVPECIKYEHDIRKWIPPADFEGGRTISYSGYNKCYEEVRTPVGDTGSYKTNRIIRYVIISLDGGYELLELEYKDHVFRRSRCESVKECRLRASSKAVWKECER